MDNSTITAVTGVLLFTAGNLLHFLFRACKGSAWPAHKRLGHVFEFFSGIAGAGGLICSVLAKGWQAIVYALAITFAVTVYVRSGRFQIDRANLIIGLLLSMGTAIGVFSLLILCR